MFVNDLLVMVFVSGLLVVLLFNRLGARVVRIVGDFRFAVYELVSFALVVSGSRGSWYVCVLWWLSAAGFKHFVYVVDFCIFPFFGWLWFVFSFSFPVVVGFFYGFALVFFGWLFYREKILRLLIP